ncbi:hypothetical protein WN216_000691 [Escherichia coli]|uniref:Uncharacterized protein n=1 Tax=Shigella flexneri serotype 5a (strain M90T) TaxID=1086030 RepID=A0A4P7TTS3_SHIFM|nr:MULTISPECIES: small protein YadW [Shigella]EET2939144.1 hypothetical protein [Escherichia coli]EFP6956603.1 hypothetical protein [Shigella sonnei]EFY9890689.1 hypothetical protein [Shigella dysenteriae]HAY5774828.1 hypothetical protein [Shigella flexneri 3b]HAY5874894.1 hypothetical protein [Shigella flexneri 5b]HAY6208208.1 hypothetical protein [Shigella flexneri X variant]
MAIIIGLEFARLPMSFGAKYE